MLREHLIPKDGEGVLGMLQSVKDVLSLLERLASIIVSCALGIMTIGIASRKKSGMLGDQLIANYFRQ